MISTLSKSIGIYDAYKSDLYVAQLCLAAGLFTMLTFIPIYLQSGLGHPSAEAGLMMLPLAVPVFVVPRIVATHLAHRLTGRALLSGGLFLVCLGLFWLAFVVQAGGYGPLTGGMLLTGIGADLRNGETTKVAIRELTDAGASD